MAIMLEIQEMSIILARRMGEADFSDGSDRSEEGLEDSEGNGGVRKRRGRIFDEKRLLDGWG